jgi:hypothetical protein
MQPNVPSPSIPGHPNSAPSPAGQPPIQQTSVAAPLVTPSLLNEPARRATVKVESGKLSIHADNSSLSQILRDLATASGMKLDGLSQYQRIFGNYGPGEPRDVLSTLLVGSGYNVIMVGDTGNGVPRELSLTQRVGGPPQPANDAVQAVNQDQQPDDDADQGEVQEEPPPNNLPVATPDNGQQQLPEGVRTPQQLLEQLQRMHQPPPPPPQ